MNRRPRALCIATLAVLAGGGRLAAQPLDTARIEAVADSVVHAHLADGFMPGMSVAVARDGEIVFSRAYGLADVERGVAAHTGTVYPIASVTKQFTAAAVMRLAEAGRISLDDPITRYLPEYPAGGNAVTVRHLLTHTSGIPDFTELAGGNWQQVVRPDMTDAQMIALLAARPADFAAGERYRYSNSGYYLLGLIIGRVTGTPYADYVERELLRPLGLRQSRHCDPARRGPDRATGYAFEDSVVRAPEHQHTLGGAGGLCSTVGDLVRWTHLLHAGQVVSPASLARMTAPTVLPGGDTVTYGYGLDLARLAGHARVLHQGDINGFNAYLSHDPASGLTIAVLTNSDDALPARVDEALARAAYGQELPAVADLPVTADEMARYEGTYTFQIGNRAREMRIFAEGGTLRVQLAGGRAFRLRSQGSHVFVPVFDDDTRLAFEMENGRAARVALHQGSRVTQGTRNP